MASNLIIATNSAAITKPERDSITEYLEARGWDVWHWFEDLWLVALVPDNTSLHRVQSDLHEILREQTEFIVFKVDQSSSRHGRLRKDGIRWLDKNFKSEPYS